MATCLGKATLGELFLDLSWDGLILNRWQERARIFVLRDGPPIPGRGGEAADLGALEVLRDIDYAGPDRSESALLIFPPLEKGGAEGFVTGSANSAWQHTEMGSWSGL